MSFSHVRMYTESSILTLPIHSIFKFSSGNKVLLFRDFNTFNALTNCLCYYPFTQIYFFSAFSLSVKFYFTEKKQNSFIYLPSKLNLKCYLKKKTKEN